MLVFRGVDFLLLGHPFFFRIRKKTHGAKPSAFIRRQKSLAMLLIGGNRRRGLVEDWKTGVMTWVFQDAWKLHILDLILLSQAT